MVVVPSYDFKDKILHYTHNNPQAGHVGYHRTLTKAILNFYWKEIRSEIKKFAIDFIESYKFITTLPNTILDLD